MDPTAALESILCGHMMFDHVEALRDWMRGGGFAPEARFIPVDCHEHFGAFPKDVDISADAGGLTIGGQRWFRWSEIIELEDSEF